MKPKVISTLWHSLYYSWNALVLFLYKQTFKGFTMGKHVCFNGLPTLRVFGKCSLGNNITFNSATSYNGCGLFKNCSIFVMKDAVLTIGDHCGFSAVSIYCAHSITIGQYSKFGGNVCIWDTDFHSLSYMARRNPATDSTHARGDSINIGDDVWVGANSIILKGVTIGARAIVGAGSVVTKNIPAGQLWAGILAKLYGKYKL
jgi:acetyltransferase-like isoleucine patch superfamily enzyme